MVQVKPEGLLSALLSFLFPPTLVTTSSSSAPLSVWCYYSFTLSLVEGFGLGKDEVATIREMGKNGAIAMQETGNTRNFRVE